MDNLQRTGGTAVQLWRALPAWAKVVTAIVGGIAVYYSFAILLPLFIVAAFGIGAVTPILAGLCADSFTFVRPSDTMSQHHLPPPSRGKWCC